MRCDSGASARSGVACGCASSIHEKSSAAAAPGPPPPPPLACAESTESARRSESGRPDARAYDGGWRADASGEPDGGGRERTSGERSCARADARGAARRAKRSESWRPRAECGVGGREPAVPPRDESDPAPPGWRCDRPPPWGRLPVGDEGAGRACPLSDSESLLTIRSTSGTDDGATLLLSVSGGGGSGGASAPSAAASQIAATIHPSPPPSPPPVLLEPPLVSRRAVAGAPPPLTSRRVDRAAEGADGAGRGRGTGLVTAEERRRRIHASGFLAKDGATSGGAPGAAEAAGPPRVSLSSRASAARLTGRPARLWRRWGGPPIRAATAAEPGVSGRSSTSEAFAVSCAAAAARMGWMPGGAPGDCDDATERRDDECAVMRRHPVAAATASA